VYVSPFKGFGFELHPFVSEKGSATLFARPTNRRGYDSVSENADWMGLSAPSRSTNEEVMIPFDGMTGTPTKSPLSGSPIGGSIKTCHSI